MKIYYFVLGLLAVGGLGFSGCATNPPPTTRTRTDQPQKRVYTQEELKATGQSETGPALEQIDPAISVPRRR